MQFFKLGSRQCGCGCGSDGSYQGVEPTAFEGVIAELILWGKLVSQPVLQQPFFSACLTLSFSSCTAPIEQPSWILMISNCCHITIYLAISHYWQFTNLNRFICTGRGQQRILFQCKKWFPCAQNCYLGETFRSYMVLYIYLAFQYLRISVCFQESGKSNGRDIQFSCSMEQLQVSKN